MSWLKKVRMLFRRKREQKKERAFLPPDPLVCGHIWERQYQTGTAEEGKATVYKCSRCATWSVRQYGQEGFTIIP
jgi:hypothetical protein